MKKGFICFLLGTIPVLAAFSQGNIGIGTTTPNASAQLDVSSNSRGLLIPRMTAVQRLAINPAANAKALMVFDTDSSAFFFWTGTAWSKLGAGGGNGTSQWTSVGNSIYYNSIGLVGIGTNNPYEKLHVQSENQTTILVKSLNTVSNNYASLDVDAGDGDAAVRFLKVGVPNWVFRSDPATDNLEFYEMGQVGQYGSRMIFQNNTGNVGIADANPGARLSIGGNIKIADGTQGTGKVLTSDANGLACWQALSVPWANSGDNIYNSHAYVGIGNANPQFRLDVSGRMRIRGGGNILSSAGIWLAGSGADSSVDKIFIGMHADSVAGFFSVKSNVGWGLLFDGRNGNMGIKNTNPQFPISFQDVDGDKISLFHDFNGNYYGMGIGNAVMQLTTPHNNSDIVFGYGRSNNFTENMRIKGNGVVGIGESNPAQAGLVVNKKVGSAHAIFGSNTTGVSIESSYPGIGFNNYYNGGRKTMATGFGGYIGVNPQAGGMSLLVSEQSNNAGSMGTYKTAIEIKPNGHVGIGISDPVYPLDIANRMRIRGAPGFSAGIWLNNEANSGIPAFIGMQADNQVGFYGSGTGWSLLMNTQSGAVSFGGNTGQGGQVLMSNGTAGAPAWVPAGTIIKTGYSGVSQTGVLNTFNGVSLTNSAYTITVTVPSRIILQYKTTTYKDCLIGSCNTKWLLAVYFNNAFFTTYRIDGTSYSTNFSGAQLSTETSGPDYFDVEPGTHTFTFNASNLYNEPTVNFFQVISTVIAR